MRQSVIEGSHHIGRGSQVALVIKNLPAKAGDIREAVLIHWRRARQPIPVFLPGESHGQRNLEGYSPKDHKKSDTTAVI